MTAVELTQEQKNVLIAEACGWTVSQYRWWYHPSHPDRGGMEDPPDYFNDLNCIHEAEMALTEDRKIEYGIMLVEMAMANWVRGDRVEQECFFNAANAPATLRAEAFGRTLRLWQ